MGDWSTVAWGGPVGGPMKRIHLRKPGRQTPRPRLPTVREFQYADLAEGDGIELDDDPIVQEVRAWRRWHWRRRCKAIHRARRARKMRRGW